MALKPNLLKRTGQVRAPIVQAMAYMIIEKGVGGPVLQSTSFFPGFDDSHEISSSLSANYFQDGAYVGKLPVTWKEYCAEHW